MMKFGLAAVVVILLCGAGAARVDKNSSITGKFVCVLVMLYNDFEMQRRNLPDYLVAARLLGGTTSRGETALIARMDSLVLCLCNLPFVLAI